ncbi:HAD domain-containing protein [Cupriavidus sp. BIS7]|uniref:HAD domain-containing protein n=1 Tax=Cupriavidus sp. BIS7 TaxID=1217718 RepID=UPI00038061C7|nr:HAD domain-containing protein [Cupriavidus sp. BIS7]
MGTNPTLYLAYDGVLHPNMVTFRGSERPRLRAAGHVLFENNGLLEAVIDACPQTEVVLHSWWIPLLGYRAALQMLPASVRTHVVGATWRSGRGLRARKRPSRPRREWLDDDLLRRHPEHPVLLDCDLIQVAPMLADCACIVDDWYGLASAGACERLFALLAECDDQRHSSEADGVRRILVKTASLGMCWKVKAYEEGGLGRPHERKDAFPLRDGKMAC